MKRLILTLFFYLSSSVLYADQMPSGSQPFSPDRSHSISGTDPYHGYDSYESFINTCQGTYGTVIDINSWAGSSGTTLKLYNYAQTHGYTHYAKCAIWRNWDSRKYALFVDNADSYTVVNAANYVQCHIANGHWYNGACNFSPAYESIVTAFNARLFYNESDAKEYCSYDDVGGWGNAYNMSYSPYNNGEYTGFYRCKSSGHFNGNHYVLWYVEDPNDSPSSGCFSDVSSSYTLDLMGDGLSPPSELCLSISGVGNCKLQLSSDLGGYSDGSSLKWGGQYVGASEECSSPDSPQPTSYVAPPPSRCPSGTSLVGEVCTPSGYDSPDSVINIIFDSSFNSASDIFDLENIIGYNTGFGFGGSDLDRVVIRNETLSLDGVNVQQIAQFIRDNFPLPNSDTSGIKDHGVYSNNGGSYHRYTHWYLDHVLVSFSNNKIYVKNVHQVATVYQDNTFSDLSDSEQFETSTSIDSPALIIDASRQSSTDPDPDPDPDPVEGSCDPSKQVCPINIEDQTDQLIEGLTEEGESLQENIDSLDLTYSDNQTSYDTNKDSFSSDSDLIESGFLDESEGFFSDFSNRFIVIFQESADTTGIPYTFDADHNIKYITHEDTAIVRMFGHIAMFLALIVYGYHRLLTKAKDLG